MADTLPAGGDAGVDDGEYDDGEFPFVKAEDAAYKRLQAVWEKQLTRQHEKIGLALQEKQEEARKLVKHREEIGVTLYGAQQQLAKLQLSLEQFHDKYAMVNGKRMEDEEALKQVTSAWEGKKEDVKDCMKRLAKSQDELNQLNITLRQVEDYNTQMKNEIQVTRRATYKAESHIKSVEASKHKQDLLIDGMNEDIRRMTEQKALYDAQLAAQRQETEAAVTTLRDAAKEMEAIEFEKKQLTQQWRSSLVGMQRRDEALQNVQQALEEQTEAELAIENELRGLQNSIRTEQERTEQLSSLKDRNDKEMQYLNSQMSSIKQDREKLMDQFNLCKRSLDATTEETAKHNEHIKKHKTDLEAVEKGVQFTSQNLSKLHDKLAEEEGEQTTCDRVAANSRKRAKKVHEEIAQKEVDIQMLHNEIARVTVDSLNTKAHNQMLKDRLKQLSDDLAERERLIEQYEQEIRKRHHQIEKKQLYVDRLNREYDDKRTKMESESGDTDVVGPQEQKIKHMKKQIADLTKDCSDMQKDWIQKQTQLLDVSTTTDKIKTHSNDQKNRKMVLEQKKIRVEGQFEMHKREIKDLENAMKHLRFDMDRMSGSVVKNDARSKELGNANSMMETEFVAKLKEIEHKCLDIEKSIEKVKNEKTEMLENIMECERQVLLWERKISLEREMQDALDPNVGQADSQAMKKEIHRMELRLSQLKCKQETMIAEMERTINKRDAIQLKYEPKAKQSKGGASSANLKRQVQSLKNNIQLCTKANADAEQKISQREQELHQLQQTIEQSNDECTRKEREAENLRADVRAQAVAKQRGLGILLKHQRARARYDELSRGTGPPPAQNIRAQHQEQLMLKWKIVDMLRVMHDTYPQLEDLWAEFFRWLGEPAERTGTTG
jgi:chromosome segregation ATPase